MKRGRILHQPDIAVGRMVANNGRAASSVKAAAAEGGGRRPAFTELADRPNSGRRIRRLIDTLVIAPIPETASRTGWRTGPWRRSNASPSPQSGVLDGEIQQLQRRLVGREAAAGLDDLAQTTVQRLDRIGNRYEISRCRRSAAVFYIVAYGATIGTEAPGARRCGQADAYDEPRVRVSSWPPLRLARLR